MTGRRLIPDPTYKEPYMGKMGFFERELNQYGLSFRAKSHIRAQMLEQLEILTRPEITKCIEDYVDLWGFE